MEGKMGEERDWDETYRQGQTPWDSGRPCSELVRLLEEEIREFRFDTTDAGEGPLGFSSLMKRRK